MANNNYYWNEDTFGDTLPENWEEICYVVNYRIDSFAHLGEAGQEEVSSQLWEYFFENDEVCGVTAQW